MIRLAVTFQPIFSMWFILLGALLFLIFLIWKEINRKNRFLALRIIAVVLMISSITLWLLQPMASVLKDSTSIILLTKNYDRAKVDSLSRKYPTYKLLRTQDAAAYKDATELLPYALVDHKNDISFILGDGLPYYDQENISSPYFFLPDKLPLGVTQLNVPNSVQVNQTTTISGVVNIKGSTTLVLEEPSGQKDSVVLQGTGEKSFSLSFQAQQTGLFSYSIILRDSITSKTEGQLPIEVTPEKKLNILIVQKYPSAEVRYLKNFLAEKGHALTVRSQISKNDFHYEFSNREAARINRFTTETLNEFDLVLIDSESLYGFSASELKSIEQSSKDGLGVIVLMNEVDFKKKLPLLNTSLTQYPKDTVHLSMRKQRLILPALAASVQSSSAITPLTTSATRVLSGYRNEVGGKIGFQLLHETYRLLLEGNENEYAALWSPLLESVARLAPQSFKIKINNTFPYYQDEPLSISVLAAAEDPELKSNTTMLPMQEDVLIDNYWHASMWTGKPGWHSLTTQDSTALHFYVSQNGEWNTLRTANQQRAHRASATYVSTKAGKNLVTEHKPIAAFWFFIVFLMSSGFLWLAPKL
jgi:hypothetical protein